MECLRDNFEHGVLLDGRYQTIRPLNHGSFGMVFVAEDVETGEDVAIKCLTKKSLDNEFICDFAIDDKSEEQQLHGRLGRHANIVNLLNAFETEAHVYLVLEYCSRGDLYEAIRMDQGPLETEHVRQFMLQLVDAVSYIHSKGVYHRDIKPENIFLTEAGTMKLGDFGLATTDKWTFETTVGSDRYMSPEQYDSAGAGYSPAQADIWAIGICLLNILFSRNPFITPSEDDPLFLDFSRDKQSLFDVFPSMSQDTYEVIVQCMNLDPKKRSLSGVREALDRVISFTTTDEDVDDFCMADLPREAVSANREPLRTPSIQSPHIDNGGAFPWAKHLQASPNQRQLSVIPDNESYTEELFSQSANTTGWCSTATAETPSMASVLESDLAASLQSLAIRQRPGFSRLDAKVSPMAGSLPIAMTRPKQSAMSLVFGRKDAVSKSWSDMWDEDEEAEEQQRTMQVPTLKDLNSRTWSHDSKADNDDTPRPGQSPATKLSVLETVKVDAASIDEAVSGNDSEDDSNDHFAGGAFYFEEPTMEDKHGKMMPTTSSTNGLYEPPSRRAAVDKWAALGERRRANSRTPASPFAKTPEKTQKAIGNLGNSLGYRFGLPGSAHLDHLNTTQHHIHNSSNTGYSLLSSHSPNNNHLHHQTPNQHTFGYTKHPNSKYRVRECPWNEGRDRLTPRREPREKRHDISGDLEWVGRGNRLMNESW